MNNEYPWIPPDGSITFSDAVKQFLPAEMLEELACAEEAQNNPQSWAGAANSEASRLRSVQLSHAQNAIFAAMTRKFETGELRVFGRERPPFSCWYEISAPTWRKLRFTSVESGIARGPLKEIFDIYVLPRSAPPESDDDDLVPSGTPGRKGKGINIVRIEFERRVAATELKPNLAEESRSLADWYHKTYPKRDCPSAKTIENNLRDAFRKAKAGPT
jgi:hypothetical protein